MSENRNITIVLRELKHKLTETEQSKQRLRDKISALVEFEPEVKFQPELNILSCNRLLYFTWILLLGWSA